MEVAGHRENLVAAEVSRLTQRGSKFHAGIMTRDGEEVCVGDVLQLCSR